MKLSKNCICFALVAVLTLYPNRVPIDVYLMDPFKFWFTDFEKDLNERDEIMDCYRPIGGADTGFVP